MKKFNRILIILSLFSLICSHAIITQAQNIGVAWVGKSGMSNRVVKGFTEKTKELAPNIKIEYQKELKSFDQFEKIVRRWEKEKDGMVLLRSSAVKWLSKNKTTIPTFIGGCNHPKTLGLKRMNNITGVTYHLSKGSQFGVFNKLIPNFTSFMLLLEKGHPSSIVDQKETKKIARNMKIKYNEAIFSRKEQIVDTIKKYKGKVPAFIIGNQALVIDNTEAILNEAGNTPVLSYSKNPIKKGALAGFSADDVKLGRILAESVVDVLVKGKDIKRVRIKIDPDPSFFVNKASFNKFGYKLPREIKKGAIFLE